MSAPLSTREKYKNTGYSQIIRKNWTFTAKWRIKMPYFEFFYNFIVKDKPMIQALRNKFDGARGKTAAAIIGAGASLLVLTGAASAQDLAAANQDKAATSQEMTGKPVTLRVGPGFEPEIANLLAATLNSRGCPTTVLEDGFIPESIDVEVDGGDPANFTQTGSAGSFALRECTADS
ncbi:MAG: hypothetical protein RIB45_06070 [Marivibrio sp.]|uniref:hypothetical protein n=1 Tax=Marivibrio sp. TaxID=2039719 RepID=UPI0032ED39B1